MVHPQCRGYVHKTALLFHFFKTTVWSAHSAVDPPFKSNCALSYSSFPYKNPLRTQLQRSSMHTTDLTLKPKNRSNFFTSYEPHVIRYPWNIYMSAYLYKCTITKSWAYTQKLWTITKRGLWLNPNTPKTILSRNSAYKLPQKPRSYQN